MNCVIRKQSFIDEVSKIENFEATSDNGIEVLKKLHSKSCTITTYGTKNPWSSVLATTYASDRENVYFNTRNNPRPMPEMINTGCHECLHLSGYSHFSNSPNIRNENSVPYLMGSICEKHSEGCYERKDN